ncbi:MAG: DUF2490 domain-containing protein [Coxiellaceae bacterium]|nr:MAG: DUF2490 domain-containing protein [Coxiellaceae bacterium]
MKQTIAICLGKGKNILFCCLSLFYCYLAHAEIDQNAFVWSGINILNDASTTLPFLFDAAAQARYNITEGTYAETRTEIGLGRQLNPNLSGWIGYNWIGRNNSSDDDASQQEQRLWQQFIWSPFTQHSNFTIRSRFEERKDVDRQVWGLRLRERFTWRFPKNSQ